MSEFIGSRISLISKSDIKYIGTLHEINSDNHTVALESVTSHGTEGRKGNPAEEVPGSDQIYEYIVFRGSDVKDLTIIENASQKENQAPQMPNDPAILGSQRPPQAQQQQQAPPQQQQPPPQQQRNQQQQQKQQQQQPQFGYQGPSQPPRFQGPGGPHGFPGTPGAVPGYGFPPPGPPGPPPQGFGMGYGPPPGHGFPHGPPPGNFGPNQHMPGMPPGGPMGQQRPPQHMQLTPQPPIGSKDSTPQPQQDQRGPPQQQQQPQGQQRAFEMSATPGPGTEPSAGPPPPVDSKPSVSQATAPSAPTQAQQPPKAPSRTDNRVAVPLPQQRAQRKSGPAAQVAAAPAPNAASQQPQNLDEATQAATAAVAAAMAKLGPVNNSQGQQGNATDDLTQKVAQMRINNNQQRGRGQGRGNYPRGGRRGSANQQIEVPKEDYDFQSANAKFNKQDLVKEAIASGSPVASPNGEVKDPIANGGANGHAEHDVAIPAPTSNEKTYDKKSSFFDNISSDLKDRESAQMGDRRQERSKNFETFGQGSVDGGRGGYRGRRGYRGNQRGYRGDGGRGRGRRFTPYV